MGGGFNSGRLGDISKLLEGHLVDCKKNKSELPSFLVIDGPSPKTDIWPDKVIDHPKNSVVCIPIVYASSSFGNVRRPWGV